MLAPASAADLPIMIFYHGGSWAFGDKGSYPEEAVPFLMANAIFISVGFDNLSPNTMTGLVDQVRSGVALVYENAKKISSNLNKLYVLGHSSGGYLANKLLVTD